jgi:Tol biopolymer transport system component
VDIEEALHDPKGITQRANAAASPPSSNLVRLAVAVVTTGVVAALIGWVLWPESTSQPATRFEYTLPGAPSLISGSGASRFALSPDGRRIAYTAPDGLHLRSMDDLEAKRISGAQEPYAFPFFSPDGQSIAYFTSVGLKRIAISGGASALITAIPPRPISAYGGGTWVQNGTILFFELEGLFRVSDMGGKPALVMPMGEGERAYSPGVLPGGDIVLFTLMTTQNRDEAQIVAQSLSTGKRTVLVNGGYDAHYLPKGYLTYVLGDSLFAVAFDARRLTVSGRAVPLVQDIASEFIGYPAAFYAVSNNGTLVFAPADATRAELVWVDRAGREESLGIKACYCHNPSLSPDGTRVVFTMSQDNGKNIDLWVWSLAQHNLTRLTLEGGLQDAPVWTLDSAAIAYHVIPDSVFLRPADGTGARERLLQGSSYPQPWAWTPGGDLIFTDRSAGTDSIGALAVKGDRQRRSVLVAESGRIVRVVVSPDGHWLAYQSNESGESEIYVRPYPNVDAGKWSVSSGGGEAPKWARDGHTLFFLGSKSLMAARVESAPNFAFQAPEAVLDRSKYLLSTPAPLQYDVSPDGQRFLVLKPVAQAGAGEGARVVVVENWYEDLKRLVPAK